MLRFALRIVTLLGGREEPRDFLDTLYTHEEVLPLGALVWAAVGKDPGFTPGLLMSLLRRRGHYRPEDFKRLHLKEQPSMTTLKSKWLSALGQADEFVAMRPADELGCLYYSKHRQAFVADFHNGDSDIATHYGRPAGVLPWIRES